ncbi:putative protein [Arabidopsis thaliana]|uniref:Uncharacterized protein At3g60930, chloroplastic n=2 Tax=Arabidopsis thaliana TaxID=3702 RepID=Y3093_ARATH|nr:RecName: Full=Uncharacterized protein At3g60930, chloroplastic; Flags: Precursor [Arabidopsis thaliana]CAB94129.1 putative protein [Arabidopsis thaliana]
MSSSQSPSTPSASLVDSSDSKHPDDLPQIYKRRSVWTSSEDAVSSSNSPEQTTPFTVREDTNADIARELDLPDDPEPHLVRRSSAPMVDEAGTSNWQDASEPLMPTVKIEDFLYFGPNETEDILRLNEQKAFEKAEKKKRKKKKKAVMPNPPGSSMCTEQSLSDLKARFGLGAVTLRVPSPEERADSPPAGFYTLYEGFFYGCLLWLPIPRLVLEYVTSYQIALSQITMRSLRHLLGILIRSYESETEITLAHLRNFLEIRRVPKSEVDRYYISPAKGKKIIDGFPSKDEPYTDHFFFVAIEDAIHEDLLGTVLTRWGILERTLKFLEPIPDDFLSAFHALSARKCDWLKHFSRERVECALRLLHGVSCPTSSESSDHRTQFFVDMQSTKLTLREVYAKKKEDKERRLAEERRLVNTGLISPRADPEATQDGNVIPDATAPQTAPEASRDGVNPYTAGPVDAAPAEAQGAEPSAAAPEAVLALPAIDKAAGKRIRVDDVSSKKKKKKKKASGSEVEKILPIFEDRTASANLLGGCVGPLLPPPDTLLESRKYAETASHFLRAVASMNRMVHSYDSAMRSNMEVAGKLAEAESRIQAIEREKNEALSEAAAAKLEKEEVERTAHVNKENAIKMAEQNLKANSEIVRLKRMLSEARGLRDSEVARAVQTTRREVSETFIAKMKNAEHKVSLLDEVNDRFMYLSQARANAQLIEALEGGGVLESEKEQVDEWLKDFADAEVNLNRFMSELKDDLKAPAPEPAPLSPGGHRSVESLADEAGITDQAGSLLPAKDNRPSEDLD